MDIKEYVKSKKEVKRCIQCDRIIPSNSTRYKARKFCSRRCNRRHFSLKRYHKIKNSNEYKNYRKEYYREWVDKNRDKFNDYMREYMKDAAPKYKKKKKVKNNTMPVKPVIFNKANVFKNSVEVDSRINDTIRIRE